MRIFGDCAVGTVLHAVSASVAALLRPNGTSAEYPRSSCDVSFQIRCIFYLMVKNLWLQCRFLRMAETFCVYN